MKIVGFSVLAAIVGGGVYIAQPFETGNVYAQPASRVETMVQNMTLPHELRGILFQVPGGDTERSVVPGESVTWDFSARGKPVARYTVQFAPVDAGSTRVTTRFQMMDDAEALMQGDQMPMAKQFAFLGKAAVEEQVAAMLENRPIDPNVMHTARAAYAMTASGEIMKGANKAMDDAIALQDSRPAAQPVSTGPAIVPGQPMVNPNQPAR